MVCSACGNNVPDGNGFCTICGRAMTPADVAQASPSPPNTSGKSIASLIFGLFSLLFPAAILAIIFGHLSLSEIGKSAGRIKGRGMAIAGLVLGYLGISAIPILIIAAIAIPNLLRARIAANESSAVASVRTLNNAEVAYRNQHPGAGYTCSLSELRDLIDPRLVSGQKNGYGFEIQGCVADSAKRSNVQYQITAYPQKVNQTGSRAFCSDESMIIRVDAGGSAQNCLENGTAMQ